MGIPLRPIAFMFIMFSVLMLAGCNWAQKPISDDQGVVLFMNQVEDRAAQDQWEDADQSVGELQAAWERDRERLTSDRTRPSVDAFERSLKELKEEVSERDKEAVKEEISLMRKHYRNITSP